MKMPPLARGPSLRRPGYAHRDLIESGQQPETIARPRLDHQQRAGKEECFASEDAIHRSSAASNVVSDNSKDKSRKGNEDRVRDRSSIRNAAVTSTQEQEPRLRRHVSVKSGQGRDVRAGPVAGTGMSASALPLPKQMSRASSLRQPTRLVNRSETVARLHSRTSSAVESSTDSTRPGAVSAACLPTTQEDLTTSHRLSSPREPVSATSRSTAAHQSTQSSSVVLPGETARSLTGAKHRLNSISKPQFSTYQQHFSPRKQSLQAEPIIAPPNACRVNTDFTQATALQDELLQLEWIYLSAHKTLQECLSTGERNINEQHKKYFQEECNVKKIEQNQQSRINGVALQDWLAMDTNKLSSQKVESLSQCVQTLTDLVQPYERLSNVIAQFEAWYENTLDTLGNRSGDSHSEAARFIRPLGQPWAETRATLVREFESCLRNLDMRGSGDGSSGLGLVLDGHARLTKGILDELNVMQLIQSMVLQQEDDWIACEISQLTVEKDKSEVSAGNLKRPAIWARVR
jgi:hypothetical protein